MWNRLQFFVDKTDGLDDNFFFFIDSNNKLCLTNGQNSTVLSEQNRNESSRLNMTFSFENEK